MHLPNMCGRGHTRWIAVSIVAAVTVSLGSIAATPPVQADSPTVSPGCRHVETTVPASVLADTVADGTEAAGDLLEKDLKIAGRLCTPKGGAKAIVLALHGITYTSEYWDSQYQPDRYSFARRAMKAGYAMLAIDRLGYGRSAHPLGAAVTLDVQAAAAHHIITQLRAGAIGGAKYPYVALLGHSYGSGTSWLETSRWNDADVVIATGWGSTIQTLPLARFFSGFYPAMLDPTFADKISDPNYLAPLPNGRAQNFLYDLSNVDPRMIDYDENVLRDTVTTGEGLTFYNRFGAIPGTYVPTTSEELELPLSTHTRNIKVPTFLVNGTNELFFCGSDTKNCNDAEALRKAQMPYFSAEACLRTAVIENAGHDLNLQLNAQKTYDVVLEWLDTSLGTTGDKRDVYRDTCQST